MKQTENIVLDLNSVTEDFAKLFKLVITESKAKSKIMTTMDNSAEYNKRIQLLVPCKTVGQNVPYVTVTKIDDPVFEKWLGSPMSDIIYAIIKANRECRDNFKDENIRLYWKYYYNEIFNILNFGDVSFKHDILIDISNLRKTITKLKRKARTLKDIKYGVYKTEDVERLMDEEIHTDTPYYNVVISTPMGEYDPFMESGEKVHSNSEFLIKPVILNDKLEPIHNTKLWNLALKMKERTGIDIPIRMLVPRFTKGIKYDIYNNIFEGVLLTPKLRMKKFNKTKLTYSKNQPAEVINEFRVEALDYNGNITKKYRENNLLTRDEYLVIRNIFQSNVITINGIYKNILKSKESIDKKVDILPSDEVGVSTVTV